ncbi:hypothetical protein BN1051_00637 [Arthrobacter saudimassiliensis]|uniref:Uncharacterized protein n=1 Tax=Arthrobacter saudimassiliensis TaxID=1461584 RepID=A0A078MM06_9MICC|nr:hypothetical protein BN1051_00637 [Arthrobacter saudimassiliensis]
MHQPRAIHKRAGALSAAAVLAFTGLMAAAPANADEATAPAEPTSTATAVPATAPATPAPAKAPAEAAPQDAVPAAEADAEGTAAASELPPGLAEALMRDLGMSLEEFIAAGELGEKAALALPELQKIEGFVSLRLEADAIVVTGSGEELAAAVSELGAVLEAPVPAEDATAETAEETAAAEAPAAEEEADDEEPAAGSSVAEDVDSLLRAYVQKVGSAEGLRSVMLTAPGEYTIKLGTPLDTLPTRPDGSLIRMASAPKKTPAEFDAEYTNVTVVEQPEPLTAFEDVPGGSGIYTGTGTTTEPVIDGACSIGFNGFTAGSPATLTAGHCTGDDTSNLAFLEPLEGDNMLVPLGEFTFSQFGGKNHTPSPVPTEGGPDVTVNRGTDVAVIGNIDDGIDLTAEVTRRAANTDRNADTVSVTGSADVVLGSPICKSGRTTFWTCGSVTGVGIFFVGGHNGTEANPDARAVWGFESGNPKPGQDSPVFLEAEPGDSGGSIISGTNAVGLISAGLEDVITHGASLSDAVSYIPGGFELAMFIAKPELTGAAGEGKALTGQPITGIVDGAPAGTEVQVTVDGGEPQTVPVAADGTWSVRAPQTVDADESVPNRELELTARAVNGSNKSSMAEFTLNLEKAPLDLPVFSTPATVVGEVAEISGTGVDGATVTVEISTAAKQGEAAALAELPLTETVEVKDGSWTVELEDALQPGTYRVSATQAKAGMKDSDVATLNLSVVYTAPAITNLKDGQEFTEGSTPETITGTAIPGATVTVAVGNALATGTTEADEDGRWSYDVEPWAAGEYAITASQQLDGVGSDFTQLTVRVAALQVAPGGNPGDPGAPGAPGNPGGNNNGGNGGNAGGSSDGDLADTGANGVGMAAAAGLLLVGGGTGALLLNRRRRGAHVATRS